MGCVKPTNGHGVCIDARTVLPEMPLAHCPAWALCNALCLEVGIRGVRLTRQPPFLRHLACECAWV